MVRQGLGALCGVTPALSGQVAASDSGSELAAG
jgi:hypothetical protein